MNAMAERKRASSLTYVLGALCAGAIVAAILTVGPASGSQASVTRTATVAQGVVQSTVSGSGTLQPASKVGAGFSTSGTLTGLFVSVGEHVVSGQLLAEISPASAESSLRSAEMSLSTAEAAFQGALEGLTPEEVREDDISAAQSRASVASARQSLKEAQETAKSDESSSAATVAQDEVALKNTEQSVGLEATSQQDAVNEAISQLSTEEQALVSAKSQLEEAKSLLAAEKVKSPPSEQKVSAAESKVSTAESTVKSDEAKVRDDAFSVTTARNTQAAAALKGQQSIGSARNTITDAKLTKSADELKDRQSIEQSQTSVTSADEALQSTLAANEAKAAPPTKSTVVSDENSVKSAQLTVENSRRTLSETRLYAPAAGVVASIKNSVGEAVSGTGTSSSETGSSGSSASSGTHASTSNSTGASGTSASSASGSASSTSPSSAAGSSGSAARGASTGAASSSTGATGGEASGAGSSAGTITSGAGGATSGAGTGAGGGPVGSGAGGEATTSDRSDGTFHDVADASSGTSSSGASSSGASSSGASGASASGESSSSSSSSSFIELVNVQGYQLVVPLSESEISDVHVGQIATVTVEALESRKFAAHVVSLPVLSTSTSGVVSYDVTFELDQVEGALKPGMSATAEVVVKQEEGINVPTSAISADTVTVVHNGKHERRRVVTGLAGNTSTIVLSGLQAGETIALPTVSTSAGRTTSTGRSGAFGGGLGGGALGGGGGAAFFRGGGV